MGIRQEMGRLFGSVANLSGHFGVQHHPKVVVTNRHAANYDAEVCESWHPHLLLRRRGADNRGGVTGTDGYGAGGAAGLLPVLWSISGGRV